jgi:hypothetical protein
MESDPLLPPQEDYNKTAQYANAMRMAGGRLSLQPTSPKKDVFGIPQTAEEDNLAEWYAANPNKVIDLSRSDAKQHWEKLVKGMHNRHVNWMEQIAEVGGEIAKVPLTFMEGLVEEKGNPLTIAASASEGVVRSVRDLYGMIGESENPTSLLFGFRSAIRAIKSGKVSQNWEEEAQQWNETRKFLWDSYKIMQGDMSVYETLPYVNMSEATAQKLRSFSNPKIAHAISFIGLELPSLLTAPFTGGASAGLAIAAGATSAERLAFQAAKQSTYAKVMGTFTEAGKRLDALAAGAALRATGAVATGLSKAISIPANMVESVIGKNIDAVAARSGMSSAQARNMTATAAVNGMADIGAGEVRQTVGYLGSLGLRTTAEIAGEIGEQASMLASGVVAAEQINGLSVLERVAGNKLMSGSAQNTAKFLNVVVDPMLQMSTAALKHGYKDAAFFAGLGYMNDRERGAVGGAAMGMVWGGYSGAVRHMWGNINGLVQHERYIKDFDEKFMPKLEQFSPEFANFARLVFLDADKGKSTRISANARFNIQHLHTSLDAKQKKQIIATAAPFEEAAKVLAARGVVDPMRYLADSARGQFNLVKDASGEFVPFIWLNPKKYRPADFGHEALGHLMIWNLSTRGQIGTHLAEFFGTSKDGGVEADARMAYRAAMRHSLETALEMGGANTRDGYQQIANQIFNGDKDTVGSVKYFEEALRELRANQVGTGAGYEAFHQTIDVNGEQVPKVYSFASQKQKPNNLGYGQAPLRYIFEEFVSGHAENMFIHTNLQDLVLTPEEKPLRMYFERKYTERLARMQTELELAGVMAKHGGPLTKDGTPTVQAMVYDDGVYYRWPEMDNLLKNMVQAARNTNDGPVGKLSPEMQLAIAKKHRKEFLFNMSGNGATLKGEKERNEMSSNNAKGAFDVIDALPDNLKPKITVDEHGNRTADVYTMKDEVIDAFVDGGFLDPESGRVAKVFRDTYMQYESSGFATSNLVYAINIGDSHRTVSGNIFRRIFGDDVPATNRVFVPFELKVYYRTTDGSGKGLRSPRGGFTATVMDYTAVHRRQIKTWSRPDVKALWTNLGDFNADFHAYLLNFLRDPSSRVDSATLFRTKFGADAEKVRDIMYETFGASKRKDESYINPPREGYFSSHENPNFPIHSLKLENLVGVEKLSAAPFPYHNGRSYEPLRRNLSTAGFEEISANMFGNGQGYRVIRERNSESSGWKVFSPFGGLVGRYVDKDKAFKAAQKHLRKDMDAADVLALPTDEQWSQMNRPERLKRIQEDKLNYHQSKILKARGNLSVEGVAENGVGITLERNGPDEFVRKITDTRMRGNGMGLMDFYPESERKKFKAYALSNGLPERFFEGIRIREDDMPPDRKKVDFANLGSPMEVEGQMYDMLPVITFDKTFFDGLSRQKSEEVFSNLLESHLSKIARSYHDGNLLTSSVTKRVDSLNLENRQFQQAVAEGWKLLSDPRLEGKELPQTYKAAYDDVVARHEWCEDSKEPKWEQIRDSSNDADIRNLLGEIIKSKYNQDASNKVIQTLDRAFNGQWSRNKNVVEALRQLNLVDKEGVAVPIQNSDGLSVFISANKDYSVHAKAFEKFMNSLPESQRGDVSFVAKTYFNHALHQEYSDLQYLAKGIDPSGMMKAGPNPRASAGGTRVIPSISPIAESSRRGNFISIRYEGVGQGGSKSSIATGEGIVFNISVSNRLAVRGGTEAPTNVMENRAKRLAPLPQFSALPNTIVDYVTGARFGKSELPNIAKDLSYTLVSSVSGADEHVVKVWTEFAKDNNPLTLAQGLFDIALDSGNQASLESAISFRKLALAADENSAQARFKSRYGTPENMAKPAYQAELKNASTAYWHEAVADHNTMASGLWDVGGDTTLIELHYQHGTSSQFHRLFGYDAGSLAKRVEASRARQKKFHDASEQTYNRSFSIGGVDALKPNRREEVIRTGLAKEIRFGNRSILAFEFSDADAYLDLAASQGKAHLLPFAGMPDAEQAFSDYAFEVKRRAADPKSEKYIPRHKQIGKETTLGKVFGHESMYYYYPEMRDVRVKWVDGHGGSAVTLPNGEHIIELGVRSFANSELNMKNDPEGLIFSDPQSASAKHIEQNPLASIVLHEAQHVLQYMANMDSEHGHFFNLNKEVAIGHFANLLGVRTNFADADVIGKAMKQNSIWSDADITATKDVNALASRIALAKDSPVFRELSSNAKPLLKTAVRNLSAFVAAEVDAGRMDEGISRRMLALDRAQEGVESVHDALTTYKEMMAVREEIRSKYPSYSANMHFDVDFRAATSALGLVRSVVAIEKATPQQRKLLIRQAFEDFVDLDYIMTPSERMARETESRRMLTQEELSKSPRTFTEDILPQGSVLGIIQKAMDSSTVETTKGLMEKQTASFDAFDKGYVSPVRTVMMSIGGIGESKDYADNNAFTLLGKFALSRFLLAKSNAEFTNIRRFLVSQKGWEVVDGKMTLVTGNYVVSGDFNDAVARLSKKFRPTTLQEGVNRTAYPLYNVQKESGTYTIGEIAEIAGIKIESEDILSLGNSVMDKVAGDEFPPVFKVSEIKGLLGEYSKESADLVLLDSIVGRLDQEKVLTKNDLLNLMAYNHSDLEMLYNVSETNIGTNRAKNVEGRTITKEMKMRIIKLYPQLAKSAVKNILFVNRNGNRSLPFAGGNKEYTYGRFKVSGGHISFEAPMFEAAAEAGIPLDDIKAFRERISKGVNQRIVGHGMNMDPQIASERADAMNERLSRLAVLMEPVMEKAYESIIEQNKKDPNKAKVLWMAMMEEVEIAALRISYMDQYSGSRATQTETYGMVGGFDSTINVTESTIRGLGRIYGETSHAASIRESGGYNQRLRPNVPIPVQGFMPSLHMLHGNFLFGTIPQEGLARRELGLELSPAMAMNRKERTILTAAEEYNDSSRNTGKGLSDYLTGSFHDLQDQFRIQHSNWSEGDFGGMMGRMRSYVEIVQNRKDNVRDMKERVTRMHMGLQAGETRQNILESEWNSREVLGEVDRLMQEGLTQDAAFEDIIGRLDRRYEMAKAEEKDISSVLEMQLDSFAAHANAFGGVAIDKNGVYRLPNNTAPIEVMTPHRFVNNASTIVAGASLITIKDKSFVDLDLSIAEPDQPTSAIFPDVGSEQGLPQEVARAINTTAHSIEGVVTGLIGSAVMNNDTMVLSPNRQNPVMLSYLERLSPDGQEAAGLSSVMPNNVWIVVGGQMYASHNMFLSYHDLMAEGTTDLIQFATSNLRDQINSDYQTGGIFSGSEMTKNKYLSGPKLNHGVLGLMLAPYVLAHDTLGFPVTEGTSVMHKRGGLMTEKFSELVESAKTADMRDPAQRAAFNQKLTEWIASQDSGYLQRLIYECSGASVVDGVVLRMNMLNTHILAMEHPERAERLNKANELGAIHGFDDAFGDSQLYTKDSPRGKSADVNKYMHERIRASALEVDMWRGVFFGLAAAKEIETRLPNRHPYSTSGRVRNRSREYVADSDSLVYARPMPSYRRLKDKGFDVDSVATETYMQEAGFGSALGTQRSRASISQTDIRSKINMGVNNRVSVISGPISLYDAIAKYTDEARTEYLQIDNDGMATGIKDAWYKHTGEEQGAIAPHFVGNGEKRNVVSLQTRKYPIGAVARRKLMVNRLAAAAEQMGTTELSVQPARFTSTKRVSSAFIGVSSKEKRAEAFYLQDPVAIAFSGQSFVSSRTSERDRPSLGFAWKRLEDGRIMLNISPDTNIGGYLDASQGTEYITAMGMSHRRTLGWDVESGTLIPMSPLSILRRFYHEKSKTDIGRRAASYMDFTDPVVRLQYEAGAKAIVKRVYGGVNTRKMSASYLAKYGNKNDAVFDAYQRIMQDSEVMEFPEFKNDDAEVSRVVAMAELNSMASPEDGYVTVILPANATLEDIQAAFYTQVTHNSILLNAVGYLRAWQSDDFKRGSTSALADGSPHVQGYLTPNELRNVRSAVDNFLAMKVDNRTNATSRSDLGYPVLRAEGSDAGNLVQHMQNSINRYGLLMPNVFGDLGKLHERLSTSEGGYFMPDVERSIALNGDRSAVIDLIMPNSPHLQRYAWDGKSKADVSIIRKSDKSGYLVGHNVVSGVDAAGNPVKTRKVNSFRTEAEAKAYADRVAQGGIEAEIPSILFREGQFRLEDMDKQMAHSTTSGKANIYNGLRFADDFVSEDSATYNGEDKPIFTADSVYHVGNIDKTFATRAEAKAVQDMLLRTEAVTGTAPSRERINLSVGDVGVYEHDIRQGLQFAVGGSYIQFAPKVLSVLRTGLVPMMERNKSGALKKVKKAVDVATGNEWYEMFMENQVSKAEMRVLGLAEFLYDNKEHKISKEEVAKFIWAMYPTTGRVSHEQSTTPYVTNINSPTVAIRSAASRLLSERNRHLKAIEAAIETAPEDQKGEMVAYLASIRKMHDDSLKAALEQFYEKDRAEKIGSRPDLLENASDPRHLQPSGKFQAISDVEANFRAFDAITEPVMATYRHLFNDAFARARLEASARVAGFDLAIADFRSSDTTLNDISNWGLSLKATTAERPAESPRRVTLAGVENQIISGDSNRYGLSTIDTVPDYAGYTSGIGSYRWDTLYTDLETQKGNAYVSSLMALAEAEVDPVRKESLLRQHKSAKRIMSVRQLAKEATRNSGHKSTPSGTMQLGHARHSDVIVTAYHRANAPIAEVASSLQLSRDSIAVLGIEELQSDPYQGSTFGPKKDAMLGSTFEEAASTSLVSEFKQTERLIQEKEAAKENVSAPLAYINHSTKSKHRDALYEAIAQHHWDNSTALFRYLITQDYLNSNKDTSVTFNHEIKHKISKEAQKQYGLKEDYVPEVVFGENYDGSVHNLVWDAIYQDMSRNMMALEGDAYSMMYGFGNNEILGLAGISSRNLNRYTSNTNVHSLGTYIATFGLQFNKEFMARLDELGQYYELDFDEMRRPPVDFDKVALDSVLDFKRRVERAVPEMFSEGHSFRQDVSLFNNWQRTTLRALAYLERAYYMEGSQIVDYKNKRGGLHTEKGNYQSAEPEVMMKTKQPVILTPIKLDSFASEASGLTAGRVRPADAYKNARRIARKIGFRGFKYLEMTPAQQVAFDFRTRAAILGMEPLAYIDMIDRSLQPPNENTPSFTVTKERADVLRKAIADPNKITLQDMDILGDGVFKIIRGVDVDLDSSTSTPMERNRISAPSHAKTMLGRIFENNAPVIVSTYLGHTPDPELDGLKTRYNELKAKLGPLADGEFDYPDTIPLGEDNAYRGVMTNWYAMRALQSRKDALVVMDARHHRSRYSSNSNIVTLFNLGGGIIAPMNTSSMKKRHLLAAGYVLQEAKKQKTHGGFIEALHAGQFPDAFLAGQATMEWNGTNQNLKTHMGLAANEIIAQLPEITRDSNGGIKNTIDAVMDMVLIGDNKYGSDELRTLNKLITEIRGGRMTKERAIKAIEGMTDGKDIAKRIFTHFEKPQGVIMNVPIGRTHGYASNYGAPLWHNKLYYSGMQDALINQVSHDAFEIPDVSMRDGKYVVTDKKTGKVLAENIASFDEAQERAAQSAKYLGSVPIVSNFLKTFGKMGGYAMEGFMMATNKNESQAFQVANDTMKQDVQAPYLGMGKNAGVAGSAGMAQKFGSSFGTMQMQPAGTLPLEKTNLMNRQEARHGIFGPDMGEDPTNNALEHATALHAMGVRAGASPEQIAAGMHRLAGFTGPMLVIRPKFPTANHMAEAKKAIVQGIPFMSVRGVDTPQTMTKEAINMYKWYAKGAKNQNQYEPRTQLN